MIEINLLPEELRKQKRQLLKLPRVPALPFVAGVIGVLIVIQFLLAIAIQAKKVTLNSLNKKYALISASALKAGALENSLKGFSSKIVAVDNLSSLRFNWARKLNDLSDSVVSGIWLRKVYIKKAESLGQTFQSRQPLMIEGSSTVPGEAGPDAVGKFVNSLKGNSSFSEDFDEVELIVVERRKIRHTEVIDFIIACHFRTGGGL